MKFYEYMQQQKSRDDVAGDLARDMAIDVKLFPLADLPGMSVSQWRKRIKEKSNGDEDVLAALDEAAKEWENDSAN